MLESLSRIECKPIQRLLDEAVTDLLNKYREKRDPESGLALFRKVFGERTYDVRDSATEAEIDADIKAARAEAWAERTLRVAEHTVAADQFTGRNPCVGPLC